MPKVATVYDVADLAGVSIATVSMAFRRPERVKPSTRQAVQEAADRLNYVPSASARGLADGRSGALGLFAFDYLLRPKAGDGTGALAAGRPIDVVREGPDETCRQFPLYVDEVQRGVELECWERGYALMIGGTNRSNPDVVIPDIAGRVDGLAVFPHTISRVMLERIARRIPVVALSTPDQNDRVSHVTVDNRGGIRAITEHLIREHGLRDLRFVGRLDTDENSSRFKGFCDALRSAGLPVPRRSYAPARHHDRVPKIIDLAVDRQSQMGLVCVSDDVALTTMDLLAARGVAVPGQVAVTGFDGIAASGIVRPALTTLRQPMLTMGRAAVDILVARIADPDHPAVVRELPLQLVLRESCGCPPRSAG